MLNAYENEVFRKIMDYNARDEKITPFDLFRNPFLQNNNALAPNINMTQKCIHHLENLGLIKTKYSHFSNWEEYPILCQETEINNFLEQVENNRLLKALYDDLHTYHTQTVQNQQRMIESSNASSSEANRIASQARWASWTAVLLSALSVLHSFLDG